MTRFKRAGRGPFIATQSSDDGTPEFSGVGVWTPLRAPKQELESQESIPIKESIPPRGDSFKVKILPFLSLTLLH